MPTSPVNVYLAYAPEDEDLLKRLRLQLKAIERIGLVDAWHDGEIAAGANREETMLAALKESPIILLLVSSAFIASEFAYEKEVKIALELAAAGKAKVVPVILKPCMWEHTSFGKLAPLPANRIPVVNDHWQSVDHAFMEVVEKVLEMISTPKVEQKTRAVDSAPSPPSPPVEVAAATFQTLSLNGLNWMMQDLERLPLEGTRVEKIEKDKKHYYYDFKGAQNACPPGWRLPTKQEWKALNRDQVAQLNLSLNGVLDRGAARDQGRKFYYWSSDRSFGGEAWCFESLLDGSTRVESRYVHWAVSCRCVKEA